MNSETRTDYIKDLNEILKLLENGKFAQKNKEKQVTAFLEKSLNFYRSIPKDTHPLLRKFAMQFGNYVFDLKSGKIDIPNKIQIVKGLIPFISDFLSKENKTITIKDPKKKQLYLNLIGAAHPMFTDKALTRDFVSHNAYFFRYYLFDFYNLISTFPNVYGYEEFKKNIEACRSLIKTELDIMGIFSSIYVTDDLMNKINGCLKFISDHKLKVEEEVKAEEKTNSKLKKFFFSLLIIILVLTLSYVFKDSLFSKVSKSSLKA